ncbi:MAG TPA: hypothetical protein VHW67_11525 [Solirubrobacteraceae bacterium]|jgi:hypothetical protein|nr:hypothetical protein [Solirubrobacteraceae bacterium]
MRLVLAATLSAAAALFLANMLGVAVAEAPTVTSLRTVNVEGVATAPVAQGANAAVATNVYREAMGAAVTDGQAKAQFLTGKVGATLGAPQTITEDGGEIECSSGGSEGWEPYEGEQPDFGRARDQTTGPLGASTESAAGAPARAPSAVKRTTAKRHRKKHKRPTAKKATAVGCKLTAQVSLVYVIG